MRCCLLGVLSLARSQGCGPNGGNGMEGLWMVVCTDKEFSGSCWRLQSWRRGGMRSDLGVAWSGYGRKGKKGNKPIASLYAATPPRCSGGCRRCPPPRMGLSRRKLQRLPWLSSALSPVSLRYTRCLRRAHCLSLLSQGF